MKRFLTVLFIILLWVSVSYAGTVTYIAGSNYQSAASCSTSNDSKLWNPATQPGTNGSGIVMIAIKITVASQKTVTAYKVREADYSGADTGNGIVRLIEHDAGNNWPALTGAVPNAVTGSTSNTIAASAMADSPSTQVDEYTIATPFTLSAGTYWIMREIQNGGSIYGYYVDSSGDRVCYKAAAEETWTCTDNYMYDMELWGCN